MPFLADDLYGHLSIEGKKESVHLEAWPETSVAASTVLDDMEMTRTVVSLALEVRAKAGIKVRQPLSSLQSGMEKLKGKEELLAIIADEVNVKRVEIVSGVEGVTLDTVITPLLEAEGQFRDLLRNIQDMRKQHALVPEDKITLTVGGDATLVAFLLAHKEELEKSAHVIQVIEGEVPDASEIKLSGAVLRLSLKKV